MRVSLRFFFTYLGWSKLETDFALVDEELIAFPQTNVAWVVFATKETDVAVLLAGESGQARPKHLVQKNRENISPSVVLSYRRRKLMVLYLHGNGQIRCVDSKWKAVLLKLAKRRVYAIGCCAPRVVRGDRHASRRSSKKKKKIVRAQPDMAWQLQKSLIKMIVVVWKFLLKTAWPEQAFC